MAECYSSKTMRMLRGRLQAGGIAVCLAGATVSCSSSEDPGLVTGTGGSGGGGGDAATEGGSSLQGTMECGDVRVATQACATCADEHCCDEGEACASNGECVALRECIAECPTDDAECSAACSEGHPGGSADNSVLAACRMRWCSQSCFSSAGIECGFAMSPATCNDCAQSHCCDVGWESNTEPTFWEYEACVKVCTDAACFQDCDAQHPRGRAFYMAFIGCLGTHCAQGCEVEPAATCGGFFGDECGSCIEQTCCEDASTCMTDPQCQLLRSCRQGCGADAACAASCEQDHPSAVQAADAMDECISACAASCS